jgi:hypothetical protein
MSCDSRNVCDNRPRVLTSEDFRRIALGMEGAVEGAHMAHPDFRVNGRIFATLHPDHQRGMVKLTSEDQARFVRERPATFAPENGAWGRQGCTSVRLDSVDEDTLGEVMTFAWQSTARKGVAVRSRPKRPARRIRLSRKR